MLIIKTTWDIIVPQAAFYLVNGLGVAKVIFQAASWLLILQVICLHRSYSILMDSTSSTFSCQQ